MRSRHRLVWNCLSSGLLFCCGTAAVEAQTPLEKLEQSVQTLPPPAAPANAVEPGYLGIVADDVTDPIRGVQLMEVLPGGPAQTFGLLAGDFITSIDGRNAATLDEMAAILATHPAGDEVTFIIRRGQEVMRADVTLGKRPSPEERKYGNFGRINDPDAPVPAPARPAMPIAPPADPKMIPPEPPTKAPPLGPRAIPHPGDYATPTPGPQPTPPSVASLPTPPATPPGTEPPPLLGVRAVPITPEMQVSLNLPEPRGALVVEVRPNSPAHHVGLPLEAVIVAVDGKRIDSPQMLSEALAARGRGAAVRLSFFRYGQLSERTIKLGEGGPPPAVAAPSDPLVSAPPADAPSDTSPVASGPTIAPPQTKPVPKNPVPPPPEPALPPMSIAPSAVSAGTAPIATPVPAKQPEPTGGKVDKAEPKAGKSEAENEMLRRRVQELEAKLAEAEAKLKADKASDEKKDPEQKK